jgi:phosphatidylinositol-4,5-bisphosphate 3-kinase
MDSRAVLAPYRIGHQLFWLLRSEMHNADIAERFGVLLFMYLNRCGPHRMYIRRQVVVNDKIRVIAEQIKTISNKARRVEFARQELAKLNPYLPSRFQLCLSPRIECKGIIAEKCNVMSSKKLPLWLCFENVDPNGENYLAIFKAGDDLRQDQMTLQLLRVMDKIWTTPPHNLDLRLNPYGCCATGKDLGMIEVVKNSATTAQITVDYGGRTVGAFIKTPIDQFLREHNKDAEYV